MKNMMVKYEVGDMSATERLSPQLKLLVLAIKEVSYQVEGQSEQVDRADIFARWSELCKSKDNVKVFASHIHSFIVFGYLVKMTTAKVVTKDEVLKMFAKLSEAEKLAIAEELTKVEK
jgi:hypothetical protein